MRTFISPSKSEWRLSSWPSTAIRSPPSLHAVFEPFRDYVRNGLQFQVGAPRDVVSFVFYRLKAGQNSPHPR